MPIKVPDALPAADVLRQEGVPLIEEGDAIRQDIRPMRIALLNLMPEKIKTETQIARLIGATPLQVELTLLRVSSHQSRTTSHAHLKTFYRVWDEVRDEQFDGLIITGAPVEHLDFVEVGYWPELCAILDWTQTHVHRTYNICWGAQAALRHFHNVPKHELPAKCFGVFEQKVLRATHPLMRGLPDRFLAPVSRYTETRAADLPASAGLEVLAASDDSGLCMIADPARRHIYMFNHLEYDRGTLMREFERDKDAGKGTAAPRNYFPGDDPARDPPNLWRGAAHLVFANWIGEIYATTPYDYRLIGN